MRTRVGRSAWVCVAGAAALSALGCRGDRSDRPPRQFFPDMDDQPKYKAQSESGFFADGRSMREPVAGTVPFSTTAQLSWGTSDDARSAAADAVAAGRADLLAEDSAVYRGETAPGTYVDRIPIPVTDALMRRGQERFNIYCTPCHGYTGAGGGMVGQQWSYPLPSFHAPQYQRGGEKGQDGYLFHVIRYGVPNAPGQQPPLKMPAYGDRVDIRDAWAIVAYMRALQTSRAFPLDAVPATMRSELDRMGRPPAPPTGAPAPATGGGGAAPGAPSVEEVHP